MEHIPTGKFSRMKVYGAMATKVGYNTLKSKVSKSSKNELNHQNSKIIFEALTKLRGTALKFAQLLSLEESMLTPEYQKQLNKSTYRVRPLNRAVVRKTIKNELHEYPENIFTTFDALAFAAASLGQVHHATNDKGDKLAVKMQYPGIDETLQQDMKMVKIAIKAMPHSPLFEDMLDEIENIIIDEVDYVKEANHIKWFQEKMGHLDITIPKVYEAYSSEKVLTMEYLEGVHLDKWLEENPSQERRNSVAQQLFDLYCYSFFELKVFQADSNIGNYLFMENDKIAFLDFGCIKKVADDFPSYIIDLVEASIEGSREKIIDAYIGLGMLKGHDDASIEKYYEEVYVPFSKWTASPYENETFHFSQEKNFTASVMKENQTMMREKEFEVESSDYVYFSRGLYGLYKIFEQMEVTIELRSRLEKYKVEV